MLLNTVKQSIPISVTDYDVLIAQLIEAAANDLRIAGIPVFGVSISTVQDNGQITVADHSTITDPSLIRAICAYVRVHFGSPADYDRLKAAYDENKAQLQTASGYGMEESYV